MTLGERIRTEREAQGLTLNRLAKKADISPAYLSQLENGESKNPSIHKMIQIAAALGVPILHLAEGKAVEIKCKDCFFFDNTGWSNLRGCCRRYPPQVYYDPRANGFGFKTTQQQPSVHIDDWCGEWKPKEAAALETQ